MKKFVLYSTLIGVFAEAATYNLGFTFKLLYLVIVTNFLILSKYWAIRVPKFQLFLLGYLSLSATISIAMGTNDFAHAFEQIIGINISFLYFYNFFLLFKNRMKVVFDAYIVAVYWLAIIGLVIFAYEIASGNLNFRLHSLLTEPAHYTGAILPAFYYLLKNYRKYKAKFFIVLISILLAGSSVGFIGMLICFFLYNKTVFSAKNIVIYSSSVFFGVVLYLTIDNVKLRVDDTLNSSTSLDVSGANWSTYALISNLYITTKVLAINPIFGNGIGSHELSHQKYLSGLIGVEEFVLIPELNAKDANSLMLRILSDMGFLGAVIVIFLISKGYTNDDRYYIISRALLVYFFYKLLREGHYFSPEMYFFIMMFYFNFQECKSYRLSEKII